MARRLEEAETEREEWRRACEDLQAQLAASEEQARGIQAMVKREAEALSSEAEKMRRANAALAAENEDLSRAVERERKAGDEARRAGESAARALQGRLDDASVEVASLRGQIGGVERRAAEAEAEVRSLLSRAVSTEEQVAALSEELERARRRADWERGEQDRRSEARWAAENEMLRESVRAKEREVASLERRVKLLEADLEEAHRRAHTAEMDRIGGGGGGWGQGNGRAPHRGGEVGGNADALGERDRGMSTGMRGMSPGRKDLWGSKDALRGMEVRE